MKSMRHRQPLEVASDLNITNLLDTAFILLITFMLVAPQLDHGISVDLPEVKESPPLKIDDPRQTLVIYITKKGDGRKEEWIYLGKKQITLDDLTTEISKAKNRSEKLSVVIESDTEAASGVLIQVIGAVKRAGVDNIGIGTQPEKRRARRR